MKHWILALMALMMMLARGASMPAYAQTTDQNQSEDTDDSDDKPSCNEPQTANYVAHADKAGFAIVFFSVCIDPARESEVRNEIKRALSCPNGPDISSFRSEGLIGLEADCEFPLTRDGLRYSGTFDLSAIPKILRSSGEGGSLELTVLLPDHESAGCEPKPQNIDRMREILNCTYSFASTETDLSEVRFSFGYRTAEIVRIVGILGFLLVVPIAATLWLRRRAQRASADERGAVWFAYFRLFRMTTIVGVLVWWAAIDMLGADELVAYLLPASVANEQGALSMLPWVLLWLAPVVVYMICVVLSAPIHRLRGIETATSEAIRRAFWGVARMFIPYVLLVLALSELAVAPRIAVVLFAAVFFAAAFTTRRLLQAYGMEFHAMTSGELRDRTFALAQKAGTKLRQLYLIPTEKMRMANAFAHFRQNIYLTDYLLKHLSRREVDAVVGHELAHLQQKHLGKRIQLVAACMAAGGLAGYFAGEKVSTRFPAGPLLFAIVLLVVLFLTRRNEYAADAGSAKLTGDAEAMITGLAKLSRLNTMPMRWGRIEEKMLTHPSLERRILRLARSAGIAEARVEELVRDSANPPADVYTIDPTSLPQDKVFSTRFKNSLATRLGWTILFTGVGIPAAVAWFIELAGLAGPAQWAAYGAGLLMTFAACLAATNFLSVIKMPRLEKGLRARAEQLGAPREIAAGLFVGLGLGDEPRIYEHNWSWDVGFLSLSRGQLVYWGEETRFAIRREDILRIWPGPGPVGWIQTASAYVSFASADGAVRTVNFRVARMHSMNEMTRLTRQLAEDLENWRCGSARNGVAVTIPESVADAVRLSAPNWGAVTSQSAKDAVRSISLVRDFVLNGFLALGAVVLAGLTVRWPNWIEACSCPAGAGNADVMYVLGATLATRVFMWLPYWRAQGKEKPATPTTPVTASSSAE